MNQIGWQANLFFCKPLKFWKSKATLQTSLFRSSSLTLQLHIAMHPFWYGKLPQFGDFQRLQATGSDFTAFDQWFQEALYHTRYTLQGLWDKVYIKAPMLQFYLHLAENETPYLGLMKTSTDTAGRQFPFMLGLRGHPQQVLADETVLKPLLAASFLEQAAGWMQQIGDGTALHGFEPRILSYRWEGERWAKPAKDRMIQYLNETTLDMFWDGLFGDFDDLRKSVLWAQLVFALRYMRQHPRETMPGLVFPLSSDEGFASFETCFWLLILQRYAPAPFKPSYFWSLPKVRSPRRLVVFPKSPQPTQFVALLQTEMTRPHVLALGHEEQLGPALPMEIHGLLQNPYLTLMQFYNYLPAAL